MEVMVEHLARWHGSPQGTGVLDAPPGLPHGYGEANPLLGAAVPGQLHGNLHHHHHHHHQQQQQQQQQHQHHQHQQQHQQQQQQQHHHQQQQQPMPLHSEDLEVFVGLLDAQGHPNVPGASAEYRAATHARLAGTTHPVCRPQLRFPWLQESGGNSSTPAPPHHHLHPHHHL
ncbi:uncharacterized protein LOC144934896 [Lampetra fluviatilis]